MIDHVRNLTDGELTATLKRDFKELMTPDDSGRIIPDSESAAKIQALMDECNRRGIDPVSLF